MHVNAWVERYGRLRGLLRASWRPLGPPGSFRNPELRSANMTQKIELRMLQLLTSVLAYWPTSILAFGGRRQEGVAP